MNLEKYLGKFNLYTQYLLYLGIIWMTHLVIISIVAFFHFQLDHGLSVIEEWIYLNGWSIITVTKICGFILIWNSFFFNEHKKNFINSILSNTTLPKREIVIVICFNLFIYIIVGGIGYNSLEFSFFSYFLSAFAIIIFYAIDMIFLSFLLSDQKTTRFERNMFISIVSLLFVIASKLTFVYEKGIGLFSLYNFFMIVLLSNWPEKNLSSGFSFLILFTLPFSLFTQYNPVWGSGFVAININSKYQFSFYLITLLLSTSYLILKKYGKEKIIRSFKIRAHSMIGRIKNGK